MPTTIKLKKLDLNNAQSEVCVSRMRIWRDYFRRYI